MKIYKNILFVAIITSTIQLYAMHTRILNPLHTAAIEGNATQVKALIKAGSDIEAKTNYNETALHLAAEYGHVETVQALIAAGANVEAATCAEVMPLHLAAGKGHTKIIEILLLAGANIESNAKIFGTPLHAAARNGQTEAASVLIAAGANIEATVKSETPLHQAAYHGHTETVQTLIAAGANKEATDTRHHETALHMSAQQGHLETVRALIIAGVNINAKNIYDQSPLDYAIPGAHLEIIRLLIQAGANRKINEPNLVFNEEIVEYLKQIPQLETNLVKTVGQQELINTKLLLAQGAPIFTPELCADTLVHSSIKAYKSEPTPCDNIVKELIRASCFRVTAACNKLGQTPLHIAAINNNLRIAEYLLRHGADVNAQDKDGNTPLHIINSQKMRDKLLRHHADVSIVNNAKETPISSNINLWLSYFTQQ